MNDENLIAVSTESGGAIQNSKGMSLGSRILGVLLSPAETMQDLVDHPNIAFPIVLMCLATPLMFLSRYSLYENYLMETVRTATSAQNVQMPAGQLEAMMQWMPIFGIASAPFGALINWLVLSAVIFGLIKLFKGEGTFKHYLSVTGYAYVITALFCLVSVIVSFFSGQIIFNSSLALAAPGLKGGYAYGLLRSLDLFTIWYYVVTAIGVGIVSRLPRSKSAAIIGGIFVVQLLIAAYSARMV